MELIHFGSPPTRDFNLKGTSTTEVFTDFLNGLTGSVFGSVVNGTSASAGTVTPNTGDEARVGLMRLNTGTDTTGRAACTLQNACLILGHGVAEIQCEIYIPTLSTITEEFILRFGFLDDATTAPTDGVYFEYDRLTSTSWAIVGANNGSRAITPTSSTPSAATWYKLKIIVNADGTSAEFFVNDISIGNVITNIPVAAGRWTGAGATMIKSAGTTTRTAFLDWIYFKIILGTPR